MDIKTLLAKIPLKDATEFVAPTPPKDLTRDPFVNELQCMVHCLDRIATWMTDGIDTTLLLYVKPLNATCCTDIMNILTAKGFTVTKDVNNEVIKVTAGVAK